MGIQERKARERQQRREQIIHAAEEVFFMKGYPETTMQHVADAAELSKGTLYLYFKSKEELHYAINLRGMVKLHELMMEEYDPKQTGFDNLIAMSRAYLKFFNAYPNYFAAIVHFETSGIEHIPEDYQKQLLSNHSPLIFLIELIEKGKTDGSVRQDYTSHVLAALLWAQLTGIYQFMSNRDDIMRLLDIRQQEMLQMHFHVLNKGVLSS